MPGTGDIVVNGTDVVPTFVVVTVKGGNQASNNDVSVFKRKYKELIGGWVT